MKLYNDIEQAIRNHALQLLVPQGTTQDDVYQYIRSIMRRIQTYSGSRINGST